MSVLVCTNFKCPKCGGADISAEVRTWCRFTRPSDEDKAEYPNCADQEDRQFDDEDLESVEPIEGGERLCHDCYHVWKE